MGDTIGSEFREISWPKLSESPLSLDDLPSRQRPKYSIASNARFGENPSDGFDLSSLNFVVAPDRCNIHIDQIGFVVDRQPWMIGRTNLVKIESVSRRDPKDVIRALFSNTVFQSEKPFDDDDPEPSAA